MAAPSAMGSAVDDGRPAGRAHVDGGVERDGAGVVEGWEREQVAIAAACASAPRTLSFHGVRYVGGCDISFHAEHPDYASACVTVCAFPSLTPVFTRTERHVITVPFVPSYLAFREAPVLTRMWQGVRADHDANPGAVPFPDVILFDGNGAMHPRRAGVAAHVGALLRVPSVGVAKTYFIVGDILPSDVRAATAHLVHPGDYACLVDGSHRVWGAMARTSTPQSRGRHGRQRQQRRGVASDGSGGAGVDSLGLHRLPDVTPQAAVSATGEAHGSTISHGACADGVRGSTEHEAEEEEEGDAASLATGTVRSEGSAVAASATTADRCKPVFISEGYGCDLDTAIAVSIACCLHRVPEPIRLADKVSRRDVEDWAAHGFSRDTAAPPAAMQWLPPVTAGGAGTGC